MTPTAAIDRVLEKHRGTFLSATEIALLARRGSFRSTLALLRRMTREGKVERRGDGYRLF